MAAPNPPFTLHRATPADMPALVDLEYTCFTPETRTYLMGTPTREQLPLLIAHQQAEMASNPHLIWLIARDVASGETVAAAQWKAFVSAGWEGTGLADDHVMPWLGKGEVGTEEMRATGQDTVDRMNERRRAAVGGGGFVHLHICFTHPEYRRRGAGGMLMKWGVELADQLQLPGWIEASPTGNFLYKQYGFEDYEMIEGPVLGGAMNMKREPKRGLPSGGKPATQNGSG